MRHHRIPKFLQGEDADVVLVRSLFQDGRINTLAELRNMASSRSIHLVGLDVEGQEGVLTGVNSIGVAACAAPDTRLPSDGPSHADEPVNLSEIMKRHEVDAHVLVCASRPKKAKFEGFPFGDVRRVEKYRVEALLVDRLNAMLGRDRTSRQSAEMILVTWGCQTEFYAMSTLFPRLARCFAGWIDMSEIVLGARVLGTLIQLWSKPPGWQMEAFPFRKQERESRRIWSRKPPPSTFPFMVRITAKQKKAEEITFLPDEFGFGDRAFEFLKNNVAMLLAVAVCERKNGSAGGSARKGIIAYACFADEDSVAVFLKWDGREIGGKKLVLDNVSLVASQTAGNLVSPAATKSNTPCVGP